MQDFSLYQFIYVYVHVLFQSFWVYNNQWHKFDKKGRPCKIFGVKTLHLLLSQKI